MGIALYLVLIMSYSSFLVLFLIISNLFYRLPTYFLFSATYHHLLDLDYVRSTNLSLSPSKIAQASFQNIRNNVRHNLINLLNFTPRRSSSPQTYVSQSQISNPWPSSQSPRSLALEISPENKTKTTASAVPLLALITPHPLVSFSPVDTAVSTRGIVNLARLTTSVMVSFLRR